MTDSPVRSAVPHNGDWQMTIGAIHVMRSVCNPVPEDSPAREAFFSIGVGLAETDEPDPWPALVGQVTTGNSYGTHMLGVTAIAACLPGDGFQCDPRDDDQADAFLENWGSWGAHLLWDYCQSQLKSRGAGLNDPQIILPPVTPEFHFVSRRDQQHKGTE